jgi:ribose/xylose/arabinose/galactoside ABC-type transport system permease subunit
MTVASKNMAPSGGGTPRAPAKAKRTQAENLELIRKAWPWAFLVLLVTLFTIASKQANNVNFLSPRAIQGILLYTTQILLMGMAETFIIISAGIDLSIGWTLGFSSVISAMVMRELNGHASPVVTIGAGMLAGILVTIVPGLLNGFLIARIKVPSFITTLGVGSLVEGAALLLSKGYPIAENQPDALGQLGNGSLIYWSPGHWLTFFNVPPTAPQAELQASIALIPNVVFVTLIVTVMCWFILAKTQFGQHIYAIGGNFEAATRAGIPVQRTLIKVYILGSVLAGIAGVIWASRFTSGAYNAGETQTLTAVSAVVIGGASLFGGEGTITGTIVGALIIGTIVYGLVVLGMPAFWQYIAVGIVLIIAVVVDQFGRALGK